ncbi:Uncharacterised protein [Nocardia otitidiscaviarum]|uniref:Uncharacterized protein n=2 Tax=Nocardia otitidiscaviarum TaxID=1823 RepID=A0A378YA82_9NOCA|nr:Uncharacterised protein [Nocardia otitidiscaviarum]
MSARIHKQRSDADRPERRFPGTWCAPTEATSGTVTDETEHPMSLTAKRIAIALATTAAALTSTAGIAAADHGDRNDRGYHYYCDRDSRGYDRDYCWKHYGEWGHDHKHNGGY